MSFEECSDRPEALAVAVMAAEVDEYVWGVNWQMLYPGLELVSGSSLAQEWSRRLGFELHEAAIECNGHRIQLVFKDLEVLSATAGDRPCEVPRGNRPDGKRRLSG